jgi:hypothetical protein
VLSRQLNILYADIFPKLRCMVTLLSFGFGLKASSADFSQLQSVGS